MTNYVFLKLIGAWGKTAINPFVMMSGFFMCTSELTKKRFLKIFLEWIFYSWIVYSIFLLTGYESAAPRRLLNLIFPFFNGVDVGFTSSFMWFYLGIPIYNLIIKGLDKKGLYTLTAALLAMFVIPITFFGNYDVFHHVFWYMTLYFVGACIRLYPMKWMLNKKLIGGILVVACLSFALSLVFRMLSSSVIAKGLLRICSVYESSTLYAFVIGMSMFLYFMNLKIAYNFAINKFASCMFGVLCIHAASDTMRHWLWEDICHVSSMASASLGLIVVHALGCVVSVLLVASLVDILRQKWIEGFYIRFVEKTEHYLHRVVEMLLLRRTEDRT